MISLSYFMMWTFLFLKSNLHPASQSSPMNTSEICVSLDIVCPSMEFPAICGNSNFHSLIDFVSPPFRSPTLIWGVLIVVGSWVLLGFILCTVAIVYDITVLGLLSTIEIWFDPIELT